MAEKLEINADTSNGKAVVISIRGMLNTEAAAADLAEALQKHSQAANIILDLGNTEYIFHKGWEVVLKTLKTMKDNDKKNEIFMCALNQELSDLSSLMEFKKILKVFPDKESALAAVNDK